LRIFQSSKRYRLLSEALVATFRGGLVQLAGLIFVVIYFFATLGMELYGEVVTGIIGYENTALAYSSVGLAQYQRFGTFYHALLACFQVMVTSNWHNLMYEVRLLTTAWT
jgi:hypothetical protein